MEVFNTEKQIVMKNLLECKGRRFAAKIGGTEVTGEIQVEAGKVFLCQDENNGAGCLDKLGYRYSWVVRDGSPDNLNETNVTDFRLTELTAEEIEAYKDWQVGDVIHCATSSDEWTVIFRSGELVVCKKSCEQASSTYTCNQLYKNGWRLKAEPVAEPVTELTLAEIAERLGVPAETLKIKE